MMEPGQYRTRRATLEDLIELRKLWHACHLPVPELEKRFTEFQVAAGPEGELRGAVGLKIERQQGFIHSEAYATPAEEQVLRPLLWERIERIAQNYGLIRLWTLASLSFYRQIGMVEMDEQTRHKLPAAFGNPNADWLTLKLKEESAPQLSLEQEFQLFAESEKGGSAKVMGRAKFFKVLAYALLALMFAALGILGVIILKNLPRLGQW